MKIPVAAAVVAATLGTPTAVETATCSIAFNSFAEESWVEAVVDHTTLNCLDARWVYRNRPASRDEYPGNHVWTATATRVPSPAGSEAAAATAWCKITTTERYRAPLLPFGDHVLFSFTLTRTFSYNGATVGVGTALMDADVTDNALGRWHFDGIVASAEGWIDATRYQHQTDRWAGFSTDGIPPLNLASVSSTLHTMIWFQANGDWRTINTNGRAGCQNP